MSIFSRAGSELSALLPGVCLCCDYPVAGELELCRDCSNSLPVNSTCCRICALPMPQAGICPPCQRQAPSYNAINAPFLYTDPVAPLISAFKHRHDFAAGRVLTGLLADFLRGQAIPPGGLLVPLPLHWRRQWQRGFNQTVWMAKRLAKWFAVPCGTRVLTRVRHCRPQQELSRKARLREIRGSFACNRDLTGKNIILLDDVVTTGATVAEASRVLLAAGAERVDVWCLARAPLVR